MLAAPLTGLKSGKRLSEPDTSISGPVDIQFDVRTVREKAIKRFYYLSEVAKSVAVVT